MTTVEAMALALWRENQRHEKIAPTDWRDAPDGMRLSAKRYARAALAALDPPSPEMVEAAAAAQWIEDVGNERPFAEARPEVRAVYIEDAERMLKAALAAALKEGGS